MFADGFVDSESQPHGSRGHCNCKHASHLYQVTGRLSSDLAPQIIGLGSTRSLAIGGGHRAASPRGRDPGPPDLSSAFGIELDMQIHLDFVRGPPYQMPYRTVESQRSASPPPGRPAVDQELLRQGLQ